MYENTKPRDTAKIIDGLDIDRLDIDRLDMDVLIRAASQINPRAGLHFGVDVP